ncbi:MAG: aminoacyl-histidine dipeptidase [Candidatus Krumholzibacteriia bacterium]
MPSYDTLQPRAVWEIFARMSAVPRGSGNEAAVQSMFKAWAAERGLACKEDKVGNLLICIPATSGLEKARPVLIQGHVDMVCEKNAATKHDFQKDPIKLQIQGDWLTADGTTLGADNGIGVAMGLALAEEKGLKHGPIEVLLTVDEERGLTGAAGVQAGWFSARTMINLDSEEDGAIFMGCAGGRDSVITLKLRAGKAPQGWVGRKVALKGLKGGHSGLDIHTGRGNANKLLARALKMAAAELDVRVAAIGGGMLRNAIPREAEARVLIKDADARRFKQLVDACLEAALASELQDSDPGLEWRVSPVKVEKAWTAADTARLLDLLIAIPNGVLGMSRALPELVETSSNLGVVKTDGNAVRLTCCSRSSVMSQLAHLVDQHRAIALLAGADVVQPAGYPAWQPNPRSPLLAVTVAEYQRLFERTPELKAIHAGLECGLFLENYPELDIVSFGPNIKGAHSPDEKVQISSVQMIWTLFTAVVEKLAK